MAEIQETKDLEDGLSAVRMKDGETWWWQLEWDQELIASLPDLQDWNGDMDELIQTIRERVRETENWKKHLSLYHGKICAALGLDPTRTCYQDVVEEVAKAVRIDKPIKAERALVAPMVLHRTITRLPIPDKDAQVMEFLWGSNGVFARAENPLLQAVIPVGKKDVRGLSKVEPKVCMKPERVPACLIERMLERAREEAQRNPPQEILFRFRWDEHSGWEMYEPQQERGSGFCQPTEAERRGTILEIHSHHTMGAFISEMDDEATDDFGLYGVVGNVLAEPEIILLAGAYQYKCQVSALDFLEWNGKEASWQEKGHLKNLFDDLLDGLDLRAMST